MTDARFNELAIFEMANHHQASVAHGPAIIKAIAGIARRHEVPAAVNLRLRHLGTFVHSDFKGRQDLPHLPRFESQRLEIDGFRSVDNSIIQEVSTTHIQGDAYYEDPRIAQLDPMQRKTLLGSW